MTLYGFRGVMALLLKGPAMQSIPKYKIFAVGDIHGCHRKLTSLMERLPLDADRDFLIFLGDYINRGPGSREVIEYLLEVGGKVTKRGFSAGKSRTCFAGVFPDGQCRPSADASIYRRGRYPEQLFEQPGPLSWRSILSACRTYPFSRNAPAILQAGRLSFHPRGNHTRRGSRSLSAGSSSHGAG